VGLNNLSFSKEFKKENVQRVFAKVFDQSTIQSVHRLAMKKAIDQLEFVVKTGKEASVFRAIAPSGQFRAVKIYKISTSAFKHMSDYIQGDPRFKNVPKEKREIVFAWSKKEFKNLQLCVEAKAPTPIPYALQENVLVMEFIGSDGEASPTLQNVPPKSLNAENIAEQIVEGIARMAYGAGLVHADLSAYNMLYKEGRVYFIDVGQAVLLNHPKAGQFFERDLKNVSQYLNRIGFQTTPEKLRENIRKLKKEAR